VTRDFGFWGHNDVEKQVGVTINQPGEQGRASQIDGFRARCGVLLHFGRRTHLLDLTVFK
jgi:hypothetical protein